MYLLGRVENILEKGFSMKPDIPSVSLPVWKNLYAVAERVRSLEPWKTLDDRDLIGVHDPVTGQTGYACVMGSEGTLYGVCFYRGSEGFDSYLRLVSGEIDPDSMEPIFIQNCLKLELGNKSNLEPEDLMIPKSLGLHFKGTHAWPQFRSLFPGYYPWHLNEDEARFLTLGLEAVCHHLNQSKLNKKHPSMREGEILMYRKEGSGYSASWEPWPIHRPDPLSPISLDYTRVRTARSKATKPDTPWEAGAFYIPSPISDGGRPFFSKVGIVCQASSGFVFNMNVGGPALSDPEMLANIILGSIEKHGFLPGSIRFSNGGTVAALAPLSKALEIPFEQTKILPAIEEAKSGVIEALHSGRLKK